MGQMRTLLVFVSEKVSESTLMALSQAFLEWETRIKEESLQEGRQEGWQEGRQEEREKTLRNVFRMRFGTIVPALNQSLQGVSHFCNEYNCLETLR